MASDTEPVITQEAHAASPWRHTVHMALDSPQLFAMQGRPAKATKSGLLRGFLSPRQTKCVPKQQDDISFLAEKAGISLPVQPEDMSTNSLDSPPSLPPRKANRPMTSYIPSIASPGAGPVATPAVRENSSVEVKSKEKKGTSAFRRVKSFFSRKVKKSGKEVEASQDSDLKPEMKPKSDSGSQMEFRRSKSAIFYQFDGTYPEDKNAASTSPRSTCFDSPSSRAFRSRFQVSKSVNFNDLNGDLKSFEASNAAATAEKVAMVARNLSSVSAQPISAEDELLADLFAQAGDEAFANEEFDTAVVEYSRAIEKRPRDAELYLCRATAQYKLECFVEALTDAMRSIGLDPRSSKPHYQLGLIYKHLGDYPSAVQSIRTALELEANPPPSLVALTLKAESVLSMPAGEKEFLQLVVPLVSSVCFQPNGRPSPRSQSEYYGSLQVVIPGGSSSMSPILSPSGALCSPFSFTSMDTVDGDMSPFHGSIMGGKMNFPSRSHSPAYLTQQREGGSGSHRPVQQPPVSSNDGNSHGKLVAFGMEDGRVSLWDTDSWQHLQNLNFHCEKVSHLEWSPDGKILSSASMDGLVCIWQAKVEPVVGDCLVEAADWDVRTVSFTDLAGTKADVAPSNGSSFRLKLMLDCQSAEIVAMKFNEDGTFLVTSSSDNLVRIWSVESGKLAACLQHTSGVTAVTFSLDDEYVVTAAIDGTLRVWDWKTGSSVLSYPAKSISSLQFFGNGGKQYMASCHKSSPSSLEGFVCLWGMWYSERGELRLEELSRVSMQGRIFGNEIKVTSDGGVVAVVAHLDGSLNVCNLNPNRLTDVEMRVLYPQDSYACISSLSLSHCGRYVIGVSVDKKATLWNLLDGRLLRVIMDSR